MDSETLKELAEQKEKEWRIIQEKRILSLENSLRLKTQELLDEKKKITQLKDDFKYNLKLLEERDAELEKYEQTIITIRKQLSEKNAEISELKIKMDELKKFTESEKNALDECKKYYLNRLNQKQKEVDKHISLKDNEINKERSEIEKYKRTLQRELQDLQIDLEKQRNELKTEFDDVIRKREHEWRLQIDELNTQMFSKELQIKMISSELDQYKQQNNSLQTNTCDIESNFKNLERKLKDKEWELKDTIALKDAKIKDAELKLESIQSNMKTVSEDSKRKHDEMDRTIREKELSIEKLKLSLLEQEKTNNYLQQQLNEYKLQIKKFNLNGKESDREKDQQIFELNEELLRLKEDLNKQWEIKAKETVNSDLTLEEHKQNETNLTRELYRKNEEIASLKDQLQNALEKQNEIVNEKLQLNLDWQRKYQYLEKMKTKDSEEFTKGILESRDQALLQVKSLEEKLIHKENVIKALQTADPSLNLLQFDSDEFQLKEENEKLKQIIKQMRKEMENLASEPDQLNKPNAEQKFNFENTKNLEKNYNKEFEDDLKRQLLEAKQKNRQLQSEIDDFVLKQKLPENLTDNTIINSHIKSLNETINILRKEKVDMTALCKKQQTKLMHIEKSLSEQSDQTRFKQTQIETLNYEMNSQTRRTTTELSNLKQNLANLELELSATRREADEYHKVTIEKNSDIASLENKISELKLKLSTSGTQVNFGAQELFIQQLQDEITRLNNLNQQLQIKTRQQHHQILREQQNIKHDLNEYNDSCIKNSQGPTLNEITSIKEIENLKQKLKSAAKYISHLLQEKQHLIEMSNQLRGELNRIKNDNESLSIMRLNRDVNDQLFQSERPLTPSYANQHQQAKSALANKLQQLEKKQYELTKQQLAFANKKNIAKSDSALNKNYKSSNYKENDIDSMSVMSTETTQTTSSSIKSENLKDIWKIIDEHQNNSLLDSSHNPTKIQDHISSAIKITGIKSTPSGQINKNKTITKSPRQKSISIAPNSARQENKKPKIRNYNDKS